MTDEAAAKADVNFRIPMMGMIQSLNISVAAAARATGFLVAENTVSRSLSDGIHVTSGSSYGRVLKNTVKETGDDMIAVVSYVGGADTKGPVAACSASVRNSSGVPMK